MCFPFCHKWTFKEIDRVRVFDTWTQIDHDVPSFTKHIYLGTCTKCGTIKRKVIKT